MYVRILDVVDVQRLQSELNVVAKWSES